MFSFAQPVDAANGTSATDNGASDEGTLNYIATLRRTNAEMQSKLSDSARLQQQVCVRAL